MRQVHRNPFTEEQMAHLRVSHYVKNVTTYTVTFTEEFKELFYQKYKAGTAPADIFLSYGIDPKILGEDRVEGFRYNLNKAMKLKNGFSDHRRNNYRHQKNAEDASLEAQIKQLKHELAYTRQEVEFLKKLQMADMEARRQWESKHQPK